MTMKVDTDCHEIIPNGPLARQIHGNLTKVGAPKFTEAERIFARRMQQPLIKEFGTQFPVALNEQVEPFSFTESTSKGSTDVGDISWYVPTGGLRTACVTAGSPGHSWQNVACIGSSIGEKGIHCAAKVLAVTALDLLEDPKLAATVRADWKQRMKTRKYTTLIPKGQKAPGSIR